MESVSIFCPVHLPPPLSLLNELLRLCFPSHIANILHDYNECQGYNHLFLYQDVDTINASAKRVLDNPQIVCYSYLAVDANV